ncbi:MAG: PDZ domain-containing protein [Planctomycetaceae bacterium]
MRSVFFLLPLLLAAAGLAQEAGSPEELVKQLGDPKYEVREKATQELIAMGERALPALKGAVQSDDLEVSLRAGRALRAIQERKERDGTEGRPKPPAADPTRRVEPGRSSFSIEMRDGRVKVRVKTLENGQEKEQAYEGESLEQLKRDHPELERILPGFQVHTSTDPFDMDDFWKQWDQGFDSDWWRLAEAEMRQDMERMERWREEFLRRWVVEKPESSDPLARDARSSSLLGAQVTKADPVLDAQLDLKGKGLVVRAVVPGSLAESLGLRIYDVLVSLNGVELASREDMAAALKDRKQGDAARAVVFRRAQTVELKTP